MKRVPAMITIRRGRAALQFATSTFKKLVIARSAALVRVVGRRLHRINELLRCGWSSDCRPPAPARQ
jgi:hypothetical protein